MCEEGARALIENTDIFIGVIDLLQELTDVDTMTESKEGTTALIDALERL